MAILRVAQMGHPILRTVAEKVTLEEIDSEAFQRLCDDMLETMIEYDGVGLAAPQVHISKRVVVIELSGERGPEFFVNPMIEVIGDTTDWSWEGCLSVEGMRGRVERPDRIIVMAMDRDGSPKGMELHGHPAIVVQHECDHLDGVLYVDRADTRTLCFMKEYYRFRGLYGEDEDDLEDPETGDDDIDLLDYADPEEEEI